MSLATRAASALLLLAVPLASQAQRGQGEETRFWSDCLDSLGPFHKNYLLPLSYDPDLSELPSSQTGGENRDAEVKFQISLRYALNDEHPGVPGQLFVAYTALSHWQLYDTNSSPFRTTDHEPELFWEWYAMDPVGVRVGVSHHSNGEGGPESRSWNRAYVEGLWNSVERWNRREAGEWGVALKVWHAFDVASSNSDIE